jgi:hypothetical protein
VNDRQSRQTVVLTEEQMEELVTRVSTHVVNNFYQQVGKSVIQKITTWVGMMVVAAALAVAGVKAFKSLP